MESRPECRLRNLPSGAKPSTGLNEVIVLHRTGKTGRPTPSRSRPRLCSLWAPFASRFRQKATICAFPPLLCGLSQRRITGTPRLMTSRVL